jgi:outer membrane murein-binding lipoprotein Lpp
MERHANIRRVLSLGAAALILLNVGCANEQRIADLERRVKATEDEQAQLKKSLNQVATDSLSLFNSVKTTATIASPQGPEFEIVSIYAKPGETNSSWTRYGWKLTLRNKSTIPLVIDAEVDFVDAEGFPLITTANIELRFSRERARKSPARS